MCCDEARLASGILHPNGVATQQYLPDGLPTSGTRYYEPTENGVEAKIKLRLERLWQRPEESPDGGSET